MKPVIVSIDGNIGAGKSSIIENLNNRGYVSFPENLNYWGNLLDMFYDDPHRWAFSLQTIILSSMKIAYDEMIQKNTKYVFVERCPQSSMVFANVAYNLKRINKVEIDMLNLLLDNHFNWIPDKTFRIVIPTQTCLERIKIRQRECEKNITLDYLDAIENEYSKNNTNIIDGLLSVEECTTLILNELESI